MKGELVERVFSFIKGNDLIKENSRVLVAVSGGPDSVFLLHSLYHLRDRLSIKEMGVLHINHMLRGEESERDEEFVKNIAQRYKLPFILERIDVLGFSKEKGLSIEEGGKILRESIYEKHRKYWSHIALGHTLDDQVETIVMRIFKGTWIKGLMGIPVKRNGLIRPLLFLKKSEIKNYLDSRGINYVIDSSNLSRSFLRNKIRWELIPAIKNIFGDPYQIVKLASDIKDIWVYLNVTLNSFLEKSIFNISRKLSFIPIERLLPLPDPVKMLLFSNFLKDGFSKGLRRSLFRRFLEIVEAQKGILELGDVTLQAEKGFLFIIRQQPEPFQEIPLKNGDFCIGFAKYTVDISKDPSPFDWHYAVEEKLIGKIRIRGWVDGDRVLIKNVGRKKVKKLFQEHGIPNILKKSLPFFTIGDEIIWIPPVYKKENQGGIYINLKPPTGLKIALRTP